MKINISEITIKVNLIPEQERKHPNLLANASITLKEDEGGYFTVSGFTVWNSKHGGFNVTVPQNRSFKYCQFEPGFWKRLKLEIIKAYDYEKIPVVNNKDE